MFNLCEVFCVNSKISVCESMSDLKSYLWNTQSTTSVKNRYNRKLIKLNEWPDFGFVGCPNDYIILSAYLVKKPIEYRQLTELTNCSAEVVNHFLYVCTMLKIIEFSEIVNTREHKSFLNVLPNGLTAKLRHLFF